MFVSLRENKSLILSSSSTQQKPQSTARDVYAYSAHQQATAAEPSSNTGYYKTGSGTFTSPPTSSDYRPRSPTGHQQHHQQLAQPSATPAPVGSVSPSIGRPAVASPAIRDLSMPEIASAYNDPSVHSTHAQSHSKSKGSVSSVVIKSEPGVTSQHPLRAPEAITAPEVSLSLQKQKVHILYSKYYNPSIEFFFYLYHYQVYMLSLITSYSDPIFSLFCDATRLELPAFLASGIFSMLWFANQFWIKTSNRAAQLMSFNNILTSSSDQTSTKPKTAPLPKRRTSPGEVLNINLMHSSQTEYEQSELKPEPKPKYRPTNVQKTQPEQVSISIAEKKEKAPRKTRGQVVKDSENVKGSPRKSASIMKDISAMRVPTKRSTNGQPKPKVLSTDKEKRIQTLMGQMDADDQENNFTDIDSDRAGWEDNRSKRQRLLDDEDGRQRRARRTDYASAASKKLTTHQSLGKRRYDEVFYDDAMQQVREAELFAEKERKKDMQRKRRREKSMAMTIELKEAALAKAQAASDEEERQKHLREAERANKKAQQTKLILQKGIKGPARNLANMELNLDGGILTTFSANDGDSMPKKGKSSRSTRPKKSKEQKQAEKDSAEAAQAMLDAGLELPSKEDTPKILLKSSKSKDKSADPYKEKDNDKDHAFEDIKEEKPDALPPVGSKKKKTQEEPPPPEKFASKGYHQIYDQIWRDMSRKDVTKTYKIACDSYSTKASNLKKTAILASKEAKKWQLRTNKGQKDMQARAKRVMRDMMGFWKRNEREERDLRKAAERQELENARLEEAKREAARQKRKLNFLISQTELYSHFIGKKIKTQEVERSTDHPDVAKDNIDSQSSHTAKFDVQEPSGPVGDKVTNFESLDFDAEDETALQAAAMANAQNAIAEAQQKAREFNKDAEMDEDGEMNFQNPTGLGDVEIEQPKLLNCQLKEYQIKGLNWLANLYEQGINGILADEMGLGKTVQSISVMAYLAEKYNVWGPFLVVSPASTLHNWQQEIAKFVPDFKVLPYWGTVADRKVLRKFWDRKHSSYKQDAPFHVMVTSYQMVVADVAYFQKMRWQYMILDEAQAIKSSESSRWKCLLGFHCRNRLLLTGTPIQNNMQELWALLHFIMPSLFDSHDEFSEWFSKDIESHAQSNTKLNEDQLKRLHMILKPFMLRRVKKHVQKELGDKIEKDVFCELSYRQRAYYTNLRNQISIMDLIEKATVGDDNDSSTLMNLVMQFRKVCNHPDLFERSETTSPFSFGYYAVTGSFVREGNNISVGYSTRNPIEYELPRRIWCADGRIGQACNENPKVGHRAKLVGNQFSIWSPSHMRESNSGRNAFSFLRFVDTSLGEANKAANLDPFMRAVEYKQRDRTTSRLATMAACFNDDFTPAQALFLIRAKRNIENIAYVAGSDTLSNLLNVSREVWHSKGFTRMEAAARPGATAPPIEVACDGRGAIIEREQVLFNVSMRRALFGPNPAEQLSLVTHRINPRMWPLPKMLPPPDNEKNRYTKITVPSMRRFVTDSGKLAKLDELLFKLKEGGHRVLLYFQMTRMIDLMEEYLTYRNWKYCRLDGSTKLEDRRDTVHDFQTRPEIFIFLLSTRAGGLGINLTSADTVIFYDSDWNPTIDSQAMDRAHRLGQTKQVTVYRLITRGTIEERIRKRALQKEEVQRVVIQGGGAAGSGVDFSGRRAPENRNRDIAMWLADDEQAELIEKREKELLESGEYEKTKKKGGKRKRAAPTNQDISLDDMYHEGKYKLYLALPFQAT